MNVRLKGGLLNGKIEENLSDDCTQFSTRVGGTRVLYKPLGETDPTDGLSIFAYAAEGPDDHWRGVRAEVHNDPPGSHRYRVEFHVSRLASIPDPEGGSPRVPREAIVIVEADDELHVIRYSPPELPLPHLADEDYKAKALDEVREEIGGEPGRTV